MSNDHKQCLQTNLQKYVQSWAAEDLVFSYQLQCSWTPAGLQFALHQQETDFSLTVMLTQQKEWVVTDFMLMEHTPLEQVSLALYDTACVEIVLQSLALLFVIAEQEDVEILLFKIPKSQVDPLLSFEGFFGDLPPFGNQVSFHFDTSQQAYDTFVKQTEILKTKIRGELWQRQRHDHALKNYLQRGEFPSLKIVSSTKVVASPQNNVIAFPKKRTKTAVMKVTNVC